MRQKKKKKKLFSSEPNISLFAEIPLNSLHEICSISFRNYVRDEKDATADRTFSPPSLCSLDNWSQRPLFCPLSPHSQHLAAEFVCGPHLQFSFSQAPSQPLQTKTVCQPSYLSLWWNLCLHQAPRHSTAYIPHPHPRPEQISVQVTKRPPLLTYITPRRIRWPSSRGHASAQGFQRWVSALNSVAAGEPFMALAHAPSSDGPWPQSPFLLWRTLCLLGRYLTLAYAATPPESPPVLHPLKTVLGLTPTSWSPFSFSHPPPLCPGLRHSRAPLPASVGSLPWSHNWLRIGDTVSYDMIH